MHCPACTQLDIKFHYESVAAIMIILRINPIMTMTTMLLSARALMLSEAQAEQTLLAHSKAMHMIVAPSFVLQGQRGGGFRLSRRPFHRGFHIAGAFICHPCKLDIQV